ncbi:50S ribosomal protein L10 [Iodidimonas gelatinilytica]|uniref:Large ribosomal subunit protein uL10 n=1 Tax=Iodidimonas gelatinilytica TaxID=1236966 RepID=A0A5A7N3D8_9PROT|nr:50S ribosomal protein L10 [Iodidimonas gelatinilytica]GEQ99348.1 50S ribosomal protein L10 [Iodidimonas gelatinilytica]GER02244.1 50S ribosomal protein L10 [Iodidimonas gelatinilytica]
MDRAQKKALVASMKDVFSAAPVVVVAHYKGLSVAEMSDLRVRLREVGADFKVTKNRLTKLALQGTPSEAISDLFTGPTAIGYSDDPVAAPKVLAKFAKQNDKLVILGGVLDGSALDADGVKALAELPSLDELRGKLVGLLQTPASRIASVLQAPGGQVARVLAAHAEKQEAA